jgi:hypothetical protein
MTQAVFFVQGCPTCGRASQVRVEYLGTSVQCRHCGGEFLAQDEESTGYKEAENRPANEDLADKTPGGKPR